MSSPTYINAIVTGFAGLPAIITLALPSVATVADLWHRILERLPPNCDSARLVLTTVSNVQLSPSSNVGIHTLAPAGSDFLSLRLSVRVCGGKGGFGSQLRAAGGRMASKRRRNEAEDNGSSRNLDGRRLRTVAEAKSLADYKVMKPAMEAREKEERRRRLDQIIESTEQRMDDIRNGKSDVKLDAKFFEDMERNRQRIRSAPAAPKAPPAVDKPETKTWSFGGVWAEFNDDLGSESSDEDGENEKGGASHEDGVK